MKEPYNAYLDKVENPEHWISRNELKKFLQMDKSKDKFNKFIKEIESLDNSFLYIQGTLTTNKTYNKVRIYKSTEKGNVTMLKTKIKRKIKKDKLNVIYWTVLVVSACFLMLTNIDWQLIGGVATGIIAIVQFLFDKDFSKKYFE